MGQISRLLRSGLVALTLTVAAAPAQATSWTATITDVMSLIYCLVGSEDCTGLEPGADLVDITVDNQASFEAGCLAAGGTVVDEACVAPDSGPIAEDCAVGAELRDGLCRACLPGWAGEACETPCPGGPANPCSHRGVCGPDGACACVRGFGGAACELTCPGAGAVSCSGQGLCEADADGEAICTCFPGFTGAACDEVSDPSAAIGLWSSPETVVFQVVGTTEDGLDVPRDLAFHPTRTDELWVVNRSTDSTTIYTAPGTPEQTSVWLQDYYANHYMEEVSAIAFSDGDHFATSQESQNTYNDSKSPNNFMGPTLWDSDPAVYAVLNQESGGLLGSHIDMNHESPLGMGIAWDHANVYWYADGHHGHLVRYDFREDHGPGNMNHYDAGVYRYPDAAFTRVADVPAHMAYDPSDGYLYYVDSGLSAVKRLDTRTGLLSQVPPAIAAPESLLEYGEVLGAEVEVLIDTGFEMPCGLALHQGRLFVGDHATGEIIAFDLQGDELGRLQTPAEGLMGLVVGPDDRLWYTDGVAHTVVTITP